MFATIMTDIEASTSIYSCQLCYRTCLEVVVALLSYSTSRSVVIVKKKKGKNCLVKAFLLEMTSMMKHTAGHRCNLAHFFRPYVHQCVTLGCFLNWPSEVKAD